MKRILVSVLQLLGYLTLVLVVTIAVMGLTKMIIGDWESGDPRWEVLGEGLLTSLGIALAGLMFLVLTRSSEVFRGWPGIGTGVGWFAKGGVIGFLMAGTMLLLTLTLGGGRLLFERGDLRAYFPYVIPFGGGLLFAALAEEWLFRGYPLTRLAGLMGRGWANLLMSLLFAGAHLSSEGSSPMVSINIVLGSLVVGSLRFTPGGIPAAWGFHFAWNFTQVLCGATLSLENVDVPGLTFAASGPQVLSGGTFGPEGGLGATIATLGVLVLALAYFRRRGERDLPIPLGGSPRADR